MPKGPKGERRPADVIGAAVMVGRIATGEIDDPVPGKKSTSGKIGGKARAEKLSPEKRKEIAKKSCYLSSATMPPNALGWMRVTAKSTANLPTITRQRGSLAFRWK